jgi:dihydroflavonol-4-reductase
VCSAVGRRAPTLELPVGAVLPIAYAAEMAARLFRGWEPFATVDAVRMARKKMFFSSARAVRDLGYESRPAEAALHDAVGWFRAEGYISARGRG